MSTQTLNPGVIPGRQPRPNVLTTLQRRGRKLLLVLLWCLACGAASGGAARAQTSCPNIPEGGSESISAKITNVDTGEVIATAPQGGPQDHVVTVGARFRLDALAEAHGRCIGRALHCGNGPCECRDTGYVYERTIHHISVWSVASTATSLNGPYELPDIYGKGPNGTAFLHVLDSTAPNSTGPVSITFQIPGTYHVYVQGIINRTPCDMQPNRTDMLSFTFHVRDKGDDWNAGPFGCNSNVGEPVNVTNGNMYIRQTDYRLPGVAGQDGLSLTRTYNSLGHQKRTGLFGLGWSSELDESINAYGATALRLNLPTGRAIFFTRGSTSEPYVPRLAPDFRAQVVKNADGNYTLNFKDGRVHQFDPDGKLGSFADRNGNRIVLAYDAAGKPVTATDAFGRALTLTYGDNGLVSSVSDRLGAVAAYTYATQRRLAAVTYPDGSKYKFTDMPLGGTFYVTTVKGAYDQVLEHHEYDPQGRATLSQRDGQVKRYTLNYFSETETHVTDALGNLSKYFFDKSRGLNVVTRVEGDCGCPGSTQAEVWTYDSRANITSHTNALGQVTTYTYDPDGNPLTVTGAAGKTTYTYNQFGQPLTATDPMNGVTTDAYDARGNLLSTTDMTGGVRAYTYDARGLLQSATDPRGKTTRFEYDAEGNLSRRMDALGNSAAFTHDARGRLTTAADAGGNTYRIAYDAAGRIRSVKRPDGLTVGVTYDLAGRRTGMTDARGNSTQFGYDAAHRLTSMTDATGRKTTLAYDLASNLTGVTDPLGRTTNYAYDAYGRLTRIIHPADAVSRRSQEQFAYDALGNLTRETDQSGRTTAYAYDAAGRLAAVTDPALKTTRYEYNARSQRTAVVDAAGQRYEYVYDAEGRVTRTARGGPSASFAYDAAGNRIRRTDYNGAVTEYTYDPLNRLTRVEYPGGATVTYAYDAMSRLTAATNSHGTVSFNYDSLNRVTGTTDVWGRVLKYAYDPNGNRTGMSEGTGNMTGYQYDASNRLTRLTDRTGAAYAYAYDAAGNLTSREMPNGVTSAYGYDALNMLTRLRHARGLAAVADYQFQVSPVGNVTQISEPAGAHVYAYDAVDRLTAATHPSLPAESYAYDAVGNRTSSHRAKEYTYQPVNRLSSAGESSYTYDANGNLTSKTDGAGRWAYGWDYENRLARVTRPDGQVITYKYDALGRRIERAKGETWTRFTYDEEDVVLDAASDGSTVEYVNGLAPDEKLARRDGRDTHYFITDHLGSTRALTDASGAVVERLDYDSFGDGAGSAVTRYGYAGRELDADTGLLYYRARWYDPQTGRFISEDPSEFEGGFNWYAYVGGNPLSYNDPDGEVWNFVIGAGANVLTGLVMSWVTGTCYTLEDAAFDALTGAVGVGLASKLNKLSKLKRIRSLRKLADQRGLSFMGKRGNVETWWRPFETLRIHRKPTTLLSKVYPPHFSWRTGEDLFLNPFAHGYEFGSYAKFGRVLLEPPFSLGRSASTGIRIGLFSGWSRGIVREVILKCDECE